MKYSIADFVDLFMSLTPWADQYLFPTVPPPKLGDGPISLRVVRALNPRFPSLSEDEFSDVLDQAATLVKDHFDLDVQFERGTDYAISDLFNLLPRSLLENAYGEMYRVQGPPNRIKAITKMIAGAFNSGSMQNAEIVRAVEPLMPGATKEMGTAELAVAFAEKWLAGLRRWHDLTAEDGESVIDETGFHQNVLWEHLGYTELPADLVITNQVVASAEFFGFDPFVALRGGMRTSFFGFSRSGRFGTYAMVSTFSMVNDLGDLADLGPDPEFDRRNSARYTALVLAQEIGALLARYSPTWTNPNCIMYPALPGQWRAHLDSLDPEKCPIGCEIGMTRGSFPAWYSRQLLRATTGSTSI
jgi:hypothetical protein